MTDEAKFYCTIISVAVTFLTWAAIGGMLKNVYGIKLCLLFMAPAPCVLFGVIAYWLLKE